MIETENDRQDALILLTNQMVDQANRVVALAKEKQTNAETIIYVDDAGNDAVAYAYDYKAVKMNSAVTFDKLAQSEYGDPSLGTLIAYYNKIQNEHAAQAGTVLRIPVLDTREQNLNNKIYASPDMQDNYGRDIALTDAGGFGVRNGDFDIVKGAKNLHQAIGNRLTTASEKRIRIGAYGLRNSVGDPMAINSYLFASVEQTLKEDPRIARVDEISVKGKKDKLHIFVKYTDINENQDAFEGDI